MVASSPEILTHVKQVKSFYFHLGSQITMV